MSQQSRMLGFVVGGTLLLALSASCGDSGSSGSPAGSGGALAGTGGQAQAGSGNNAGGQAGAIKPDSFKDYQADPAVFSEVPDQWLDLDANKIATNQLVVVFRPDATEAQRAAAASALKGTWVGQLPTLGIYQMHLEAATVALIQGAATNLRAQAGVEAVTFNYLLTPMEGDPCPADDDNLQFSLSEGCAFTDIDYYTAGTMMDTIRKYKSLSRVKVGVLDTGLAASNGQFENTPLLNVNDQGVLLTDSKGHGTAVCSLIAADDRDGVINGIATRMTGGMVDLAFAGMGDYSLEGALTSLQQAVDRGHAVIVNLSLGVINDSLGLEMIGMHLAWERLFAAAPNTLFVIAAGNESIELNTLNVLPAGVKLDNTLVVGGTANCDPLHAYPDSVYGPLVDIAAPAMNIPVATVHADDTNFLTGTSFSAPIVTSLAVVLKSIAPDLSPTELKRYILDHSYLTESKVSSRRMVLTEPVAQLVVDRGAPAELLKVLDALDPLGDADAPGAIMTRICGGAHLDIEETGAFDFPSDPDNGLGVINPMGLVLAFQNTDQTSSLTINLQVSFALGAGFAIPSPVTLSFTNNTTSTSGLGTSGSLVLDGCRIVEREGYADTPLVVEVTGSVGGMMDVQKPPKMEPTPTQFHAAFTTLVTSMGDQAVNAYLDANCKGGKGR